MNKQELTTQGIALRLQPQESRGQLITRIKLLVMRHGYLPYGKPQRTYTTTGLPINQRIYEGNYWEPQLEKTALSFAYIAHQTLDRTIGFSLGECQDIAFSKLFQQDHLADAYLLCIRVEPQKLEAILQDTKLTRRVLSSIHHPQR